MSRMFHRLYKLSLLTFFGLLLACGTQFWPSKAQAEGFYALNGTYIDESCIGNNRETLDIWNTVLARTNAQIANCAMDYNLPTLKVAIEFLNRSRIFCRGSNRYEVAGHKVSGSVGRDWMAWAPFSLVGNSETELKEDWESAPENMRIIVFNANRLERARGGFLPYVRSFNVRGPEGFGQNLFHESIHYLTRLGHNTWRKTTSITTDVDPIYGLTARCFPIDGQFVERACTSSLQILFNAPKSAFGPISGEDASRSCNAKHIYDLLLKDFFRAGLPAQSSPIEHWE